MDIERLCMGVDRAWAFRAELAKVRGLAYCWGCLLWLSWERDGVPHLTSGVCRISGPLLDCLPALTLDPANCMRALPTRPPSPVQQVTGEAGQRGWAEGAPAQALAGLSAAYAEVVQPNNKMKVRPACTACVAHSF